MNLTLPCICALVLFLPFSIFDSEIQAQPRAIDCKDTARLNQQELNFCAAQSAKASDAKLNEVYRRLRAVYRDNKALGAMLIDAQLAWIKFRDTNCKFSQNRFARGSIAPLVFHNCIEEVTKQRISELEQYMPR